MAGFGFRGLGWFLCAVVAAPACYIVSSQVAAERARVESIERAIVQARKDIRMLETEFDTRASLAQLERWNGEVLALTAPRAGQFVPSEAALGALRDLPGSDQPQLATYIVPAGVADTARPPVPERAEAAPTPAPAPAKRSAPVALASADPAPAAPGRARLASDGARPARVQAVAMLDRKLLRDTDFSQLIGSAGEGSRKR